MKEWFKARNIWGAAIDALSDAEAGRLMKAVWHYTMTNEEPNLSGGEKIVFALIRMTLSQDEAETADLSEKRAKAGSSGGKQKVANEAIAKVATENEANVAIATNKNKNKNKETDKEIKEKEYKEKETRFDRFWAAYPRHVAKQEALKAFLKLNPDEELLRKMIDAIEKSKRSAQWQEAGGQYIPHPSTWLNQRRWEDDAPKPAQAKTVVAQQYEQRDYSGQSESMDDVLNWLQGRADA